MSRDFGGKVERDAMPLRGARFFRDPDGAVQFVFVIDNGNIIGPRPATDADKANHAQAWSEFERTAAPAPALVEVAVAPARAGDDAPAKRKYTRRQEA